MSSLEVQSGIEEIDNEINIKNIVWVKQNPGHKDFSSIASALASITTATATDQFLIKVAPGTYTEPQIIMKPFVSIAGVETQSVIIKPSDPTNHLIVGAAASTLRYCTVMDVTAAGKAGVYNTASGFQLRNCVVRDNPINVLVEGISSLASITADDLIITGVFTTGIQLKNSGAGVQGVFKGSIVNSVGTPSGSKAAVVEGADVSFIFSSLVASGIGTAHCLTVKNGATMKILAAEIKGFNKAIWVENSGTGAVVDFQALNLDSNTTDVQIDHTGATGAIAGIITRSKVVNMAPYGVQLTYQDPITGDLNTTRILATRGFATDLTSVVASATTTQIVSTDAHVYYITGSTLGQIMQLPNATTLRVGHQHWIINEASVQVTAQQFGGSNAVIVNANGSMRYVLRDNSTSAGIWVRVAGFASAFSGGSSPILASYNGNANVGRYLEIWPSLASDTDPFIVPNNEVLVGVVLGSEANSTCTVGLFKTSNLITPVTSISLAASTEVVNISLNIPLSTLDKLAVRVTSGTVNKPRFAFYLSGI
jgi:hypothetical protein